MDELTSERLIAEVAVEGTLYAFDRLFGYEIPERLSADISAGVRVVVPFGKGNRKRVGLVFSVYRGSAEGLKPIRCAVDEEPVVSLELIDLCRWIRDNTFCTYYDAFRAILPPGLGYSLKTRYSLTPDFSGSLSDEESRLAEVLRTAGDRASFDAVVAAQRELDGARVLRALIEKGALYEDDILSRRVGDSTVAMLRAAEEPPEGVKLTPKQREVLRFVEASECASVRESCYACTVTPAVVKRLTEKGFLEQYENVVFRTDNGEEAS